MRNAIRSLLFSLMLGLLDAMRTAEDPAAERLSFQWVMRAPVNGPFAHPERCWFWGESSLSS
jgi:hypothetical protein